MRSLVPHLLIVLSPLAVALFGSASEELPLPADDRLVASFVPRAVQADATFAYMPSPVTGSYAAAIEHLSLASMAGDGKRVGNFHVDQEVPGDLRATARDYQQSRFDIGHGAPDGNVGDDQAKVRRAIFTNAAPQKPGLNRGLWRQIEDAVRATIDERHSAIVVTVPIYCYRSYPVQTIGPGHIFVPTHFAKAAVVLDGEGKPEQMLAWLVENKTPGARSSLDLSKASVDEIERLTQSDLFAWLPDDIETKWEAAK